jgi:hypothetical protein
MNIFVHCGWLIQNRICAQFVFSYLPLPAEAIEALHLFSAVFKCVQKSIPASLTHKVWPDVQQKTPISFAIPVCLSVGSPQICPNWMNFLDSLYRNFIKLCWHNSILVIFHKNKWHFTRRPDIALQNILLSPSPPTRERWWLCDHSHRHPINNFRGSSGSEQNTTAPQCHNYEQQTVPALKWISFHLSSFRHQFFHLVIFKVKWSEEWCLLGWYAVWLL